MLNFLRGTVVRITANRVVLDVGGIGIEVSATPSALGEMKSGEIATLDASLVIREDAWTVYGFANQSERELFEALRSVSGIGPKLALTILSAISPVELANAISSGDESRLVRIPGVGKKSAARLILELGDKLPQSAAAQPSWRSDILAALKSLGWSDKDAQWAIGQIDEDLGDSVDSSIALKAALQALGKEPRK